MTFICGAVFVICKNEFSEIAAFNNGFLLKVTYHRKLLIFKYTCIYEIFVFRFGNRSKITVNKGSVFLSERKQLFVKAENRLLGSEIVFEIYLFNTGGKRYPGFRIYVYSSSLPRLLCSCKGKPFSR